MTATTIISFHSYGKKPCPDGLLSAYFTKVFFSAQSDFTYFVPNARTPDSFKRFKEVLEKENKKGHDKINIVYVDCTPSLKEEIKYLSDLPTEKYPIYIYDHHELNEDFKNSKTLKYKFVHDRKICAATIMFHQLDRQQAKKLDIGNLVDFIQFSEYESENAAVAQREDVDRVMQEIKGKVTTSANKELIEKIDKKGLLAYYVLDMLMPSQQNWDFFYEAKAVDEYEVINTKFSEKVDEYVRQSSALVSGGVAGKEGKFGKELLSAFLDKLERVKGDFRKIKIIQGLKVGKKACNVGVYEMDIFQCGRSMEPLLRENMQAEGTEFSIIINNPTTNAKGEKSYYLSLRRRDQGYDCKDLVAFFKDNKITKIAGGHPHASGATLNEDEFSQFMKKYLA